VTLDGNMLHLLEIEIGEVQLLCKDSAWWYKWNETTLSTRIRPRGSLLESPQRSVYTIEETSF